MTYLDYLSLCLVAASAIGVLILLMAWFFAARSARSWAAERRKTEDVLRKAHDELEVQVKQRTADLLGANEELRREISERKQAEDELQRFFNLIPDLVCVASFDGYFLKINSAWQETLGFTEQEILSKPFLDLIHPDDRAVTMKEVERQLAGEPTLQFINRFRRKDGSYKWLEWRATPAVDNKLLFASARDITERKRAEDSLRKLSLAVEQSSSSIIITDIDANIEYVNEGFVKVTGYSRAEVVGQNPRILQSGKTLKASYDDLWAHLTRGEVWKGEFINRRKDGSEYIESILISPVRQADGSVTHYLAIKEDITQFKQAQEALRDSLENLHGLLNSMAEGAYGVDTKGNCTFVNRAFLQLLGYQNENEVLGKHIHEHIHHSHADGSRYPESECKVYRAYRTNQLSNVTNEVFWRKDGVAIPVEFWAHPIVTGDVVTGAIVTFIDITTRKRAEESLKNMAAKFHALFELSADAIMLLDEKGFFDCNEATLRLFGFSTRNDFISKHPAGLSPPTQPGGKDSLSLANEHIAMAAKNGSVLFEWMHRRLDGTDFPAEVLLTALELDGKPVLQATVRDITKRKQMEDALRVSRENLHRLLNSIVEGAYGVDTNGNCTFVNQAFLQMLGYQNDGEVLGKKVHQLIHHSHADGSPYPANECRAYDAYRLNKSINVSDEVFWRKDGVAIPVEYWGHSIEYDGVVMGAIFTFIDITERKKAESQLVEQLDELRRWHDATSGREERILELKHETNELLAQAGQPPRYPSAESQDQTEE